jgi:hypothetical protein
MLSRPPKHDPNHRAAVTTLHQHGSESQAGRIQRIDMISITENLSCKPGEADLVINVESGRQYYTSALTANSMVASSFMIVESLDSAAGKATNASQT